MGTWVNASSPITGAAKITGTARTATDADRSRSVGANGAVATSGASVPLHDIDPPVPPELLPIQRRRGSVIVKRVFDLALASLLLVIAAPFLFAIALAIKIDSPGAILFRSPRVGRKGAPLGMLKFRTMIDRAHGQRDGLRHLSDAPVGVFKIENDPRVTRVGKVLRRVSLDELPQLWHVVTGEMSLVGPRPLPPEEDELIGKNAPRRFVRPGLTGPWQVAGSWRVPLNEMLRLERDYFENWSLRSDLTLLAVTVKYVLSGRGV